jgi:hypothetical protein
MRCWVLEGSLDESKRDEFDQSTNDTTTNNEYPINTFKISANILSLIQIMIGAYIKYLQ